MPTDFGPPFDYQDADLILRASDGVDFRVHKAILGLASPFFRDFPYDINMSSDTLFEERKDGLAVIPMVCEDAQTVRALLCIAYAGRFAPMNSFNHLRTLLEAGRKYEFSRERLSEAALCSAAIQEKPLATYALACAHGFRALVAAAAKELLKCPPDLLCRLDEEDRKALRLITGEDLYNIVRYRRECQKATLAVFDEGFGKLVWGGSDWSFIACERCPKTPQRLFKPHGLGKATMFSPAAWFWSYVVEAKAALELRTCEDDVVSPALLTAACAKAGAACSTKCGPVASREMLQFSERLRLAIRKRIAQVHVQLQSFCTPSQSLPLHLQVSLVH